MLQLGDSSKNLHVEATFEGRTSVCNQLVQEQTAYSLILSPDGDGLSCKLVRRRDGRRTDDDLMQTVIQKSL